MNHDKMIRCTGTLQPIDTSDLAPQFRPYLNDFGHRLEVTSGGYTRRGYVVKTTGWKPAYILLPRRNSSGSSDILNHADRIVRVLTMK